MIFILINIFIIDEISNKSEYDECLRLRRYGDEDED